MGLPHPSLVPGADGAPVGVGPAEARNAPGALAAGSSHFPAQPGRARGSCWEVSGAAFSHSLGR